MAAYYQTHSITLATLLPQMELGKAAAIEVRSLCLDSRHLKIGDVFIALVGTKVDGRTFIATAIELGAAAVVVEAEPGTQTITWVGAIPVIAIEKLAEKVSAIAGRFYGCPSHNLSLIGITGTNGKTTCSLLAAQLLARLQQKSAVIGTIGYGLVDATSIVRRHLLLPHTRY